MLIPFPAPASSKTLRAMANQRTRDSFHLRNVGKLDAYRVAVRDAALLDEQADAALTREARLGLQQADRRLVEPGIARGCQAILDMARRK